MLPESFLWPLPPLLPTSSTMAGLPEPGSHPGGSWGCDLHPRAATDYSSGSPAGSKLSPSLALVASREFGGLNPTEFPLTCEHPSSFSSFLSLLFFSQRACALARHRQTRRRKYSPVGRGHTAVLSPLFLQQKNMALTPGMSQATRLEVEPRSTTWNLASLNH